MGGAHTDARVAFSFLALGSAYEGKEVFDWDRGFGCRFRLMRMLRIEDLVWDCWDLRFCGFCGIGGIFSVEIGGWGSGIGDRGWGKMGKDGEGEREEEEAVTSFLLGFEQMGGYGV